MFKNKIIIIDIRTDEEIKLKHLISYSNDTIVMFIPVSHIKFNEKTIRDMSKENFIYIICRKAKRSSLVKNTYFADDKNIKSIDGGINKLEYLNDLQSKLRVVIYKSAKNIKLNYSNIIITLLIFGLIVFMIKKIICVK